MSSQEFRNELEALGYEVQEPMAQSVTFEYTVPLGKNKGKKILIGFEKLNSYPMNCPHGPHFKTVGVKDWINPTQATHESNFGPEWIHWSRPFNEWNKGERTVKRYLAHIRNVLAKL